MKDIPKWILNIVDTNTLYCQKCKEVLREGDIASIGIQESSVAPHDDKLCVGMICSSCKDMTIFELKEMSLIELSFEILEGETKPKKSEKIVRKSKKKDILEDLSGIKKKKKKKKRSAKSKITEKEQNEVRRFLKKAKTHEEVLVAMGMSPDQIAQYNYKKTDED